MIPNAQRPALTEDPRIDRYRALLAQTAIFKGATPSALDDLARRLQVRTRPAAAIIVAHEDPGDAMFILVSGRAKVALFGDNGRELTLTELKPGDFFGEMSLLDDRPRSANVVAIDDVTMLTLTRDAFAAHLQNHPRTAINMLGELTRRLRRADETIANLALHDVESRLVRTLERLAKEDGEQTEAGLLLRRRPTQQDLANMIGSCRETISRAFNQLARDGLIIPRGRSLVVTPALIERAEKKKAA